MTPEERAAKCFADFLELQTRELPLVVEKGEGLKRLIAEAIHEALEEAAKLCRTKAVAEAPHADEVERGWEMGCLSCECAIRALQSRG